MIYLINAETKEHRVYKPGDVVDSRIWKIVEADADGWIEWAGESDSSPVPRVTLCRIKLSDGCELETMAPEEWSWSRGGDQHIIAYRPILSEPEAPEWDGEGLPPVGCECEALWNESCLEYLKAKVFGVNEHGQPIFRFEEGPRKFEYQANPLRTTMGVTAFRPLRTAAQRAQEEAVRAMADIYRKAPHFSIYDSVKCVYAAIRDGKIPGVRLTGNPRR